jgi:anti-sigma B factor antagonist
MDIDEVLRIEVEDTGDEVVVSVAGEIDVATCLRLEQAATDAIAVAADRSGGVVLDLSEVGFIDSSGLRVLIGVRQLAETEQVPMALRSPSRAVHRLLELTALTEQFTIRS